MPGARLDNFRKGDRTELLVEYVLNVLAFSTRVPRQEDVGHDLLCALAEPHGAMLWAGPSFTVQVKSDTSPIVFSEDYELQWLSGQENPFFVAVGNKKEMRVSLYSTWQRVRAFLQNGTRKTTLKFENPPDVSRVVESEAPNEQTIYLGEPVVSLTLQELVDSDALENARTVLAQWIEVDRRNIVASSVGIHWTLGPASYATNVRPSLDEVQIALFWNTQNVNACVTNFARSAALLRLTLEPVRRHPEARVPPEKIEALDAALKAWADVIDPGSKDSLQKFCSLSLGPPAGGPEVPPRGEA